MPKWSENGPEALQNDIVGYFTHFYAHLHSDSITNSINFSKFNFRKEVAPPDEQILH